VITLLKKPQTRKISTHQIFQQTVTRPTNSSATSISQQTWQKLALQKLADDVCNFF
jgi:hypothetical protein